MKVYPATDQVLVSRPPGSPKSRGVITITRSCWKPRTRTLSLPISSYTLCNTILHSAMTGTSVMNCACRFVLSCCCKWLLLVRDCPWGLLAVVLGLKLAAVILSFHWGCFLDSVSLLKPLRCFVLAPWHRPSHTY